MRYGGGNFKGGVMNKVIDVLWNKYSSKAYEDDCEPYNVVYRGNFDKLYNEINVVAIELKKDVDSNISLAQIQSSKLNWAIGLFTDEQHEWFKGMLKTQELSLEPPTDHVKGLSDEIEALKRIIQNSSKVNELLKKELEETKWCRDIELSRANNLLTKNKELKKEIEELKMKPILHKVSNAFRDQKSEIDELRDLVESAKPVMEYFTNEHSPLFAGKYFVQWLKEASEVLK